MSLGFSSRMITGTKEIQTVLATIVQSPESKFVGSLPIANTAVKVVANNERRYESAMSFIYFFPNLGSHCRGSSTGIVARFSDLPHMKCR